MRPIATIRASARSPLLQVLKTSVAAILAWVISAALLSQPLPIFAAIAALLVVQPSVNQSLAKGVERSIGVIVGVVIAYAAGLVLGRESWVVLGIIVVSLLIAWALKLTPGSSNQIPISAMLVLAIGTQSPAYAVDRIIETIIGAVVGLIVNALIVPPVLLSPARLAVGRLAVGLASTLENLAGALSTPRTSAELAELMAQARGLRPLQAAASDAIDAAEESLTFNPRASRYRDAIQRNRDALARLSILVTRTLGMTRAVRDGYDPALLDDPVVPAIGHELSRAAHDVRLLARTVEPPSESTPGRSARRGSRGARGTGGTTARPGREVPVITADLPALTAPLVVMAPDPEHWIIVGALLEDLRRIREELVGSPDA
ncbi:FUSC family protein [Marisediminicola senii]|uniref:FUSC family protein n=1 Tax=Marisediminicola senii TaxID=2711233 RepID=UPI0013EA9CF1|nr:FUSC family protein [Marisediminicola senii]